MSQSFACVMLFGRHFDCCLYSLALLHWWVSTSPSGIGTNSGIYLIWTWFNYILAMSALYMDSPSLADRFLDQITDAFVYSAFCWRRYLPAQYVCALRCL
jgi:hypothetical protein